MAIALPSQPWEFHHEAHQYLWPGSRSLTWSDNCSHGTHLQQCIGPPPAHLTGHGRADMCTYGCPYLFHIYLLIGLFPRAPERRVLPKKTEIISPDDIFTSYVFLSLDFFLSFIFFFFFLSFFFLSSLSPSLLSSPLLSSLLFSALFSSLSSLFSLLFSSLLSSLLFSCLLFSSLLFSSLFSLDSFLFSLLYSLLRRGRWPRTITKRDSLSYEMTSETEVKVRFERAARNPFARTEGRSAKTAVKLPLPWLACDENVLWSCWTLGCEAGSQA